MICLIDYQTENVCTHFSYRIGHYVAAGIPIQIDVIEETGAPGWSARIGCHTDDLNVSLKHRKLFYFYQKLELIKGCDEFRRWPCISISKLLTKGKPIHINSAFGGLLFLQSPKGQSNSITVNIHHVVVTPTYDLADPNRAEHWLKMQSSAEGLWADISGRYIVFNLPSKSVLHLTDEQLDRALKFWDAVILAHHQLRGTMPEYRERIVCDEQPSAGYMRRSSTLSSILEFKFVCSYRHKCCR